MPDCEACAAAAINPNSGLYHAKCDACQGRMFDSAIALHLGNLKSIPSSQDRAAYIETIERKHGKTNADKLKAAYMEYWNARKSAKA